MCLENIKHKNYIHHFEMNSPSRKSASKKLIVFAILFVFIVGASTVAAYSFFSTQSSIAPKQQLGSDNVEDKAISYDAPTDEEKEAGDQQKNQTVNPESKPQDSTVIDVSFTAVNQSENIVQVRALIQGLVNGTCTLIVENNTLSKSYTASTQALANMSTCNGFNIPVSDLQAGSWNIKLTVNSTNNSQKGDVSTTLTVK